MTGDRKWTGMATVVYILELDAFLRMTGDRMLAGLHLIIFVFT
jgi:hypothetical protein